MTQSIHDIRRWLLPAAAVLALAACTTATPYQPLGTRGASGGFAEQRIEANRYRVTFVGNDYTSRQRVENYLLYRAAELTMANGYDGFTIVRRDTERNVDTRIIPSAGPYPYWQPYWRYRGRYGWRSWDPWFGDPFWGDTIDVRTVESYEATTEIVMFRGAPRDPTSFNARQVIANLQPTIVVPK
jgi:hypothetical protein